MKKQIISHLVSLVIFLLPSFLVVIFLKFIGYRIGRKCRFGFSWVLVNDIEMADKSSIGHFNIIRIDRLKLGKSAYIGRLNVVNGPLVVELATKAAIGNSNKIVRGRLGFITYGVAYLKLGELTKITSKHHLDCTQSICFGDFSILAGIGSQIWSHGYIHEMQGAGRYRIDGGVEIGDNVYIGSGCIVSMGVRIASSVIVGAGVTVARSLIQPGLYVSGAMRQLPRPVDPDVREDLDPVQVPSLCERVYLKRAKA
ncbi:acyltransferase [Azonexus hydrophilus]|uniref:acyltransferase n=1 Tax=Azonexus hydrophilus TaxID=418702 RepID=UPI0012FAEF10|nr:hypothetical protein [Azonexus hydrophilus]